MPCMGRILSGKRRAMDMSDPKSGGGSAGRKRRSHVRRDVQDVADDMIAILRMSPDDGLKDHVRRQVARVVEFDGGRIVPVDGGDSGVDADGVDGAYAVGPASGGGGGGGDGGGADTDGGMFHSDIEAKIWGDA